MKPLSSITVFLCSSSRHLFRHRTTLPPFGETLVGISHFSTSSPDSSSYQRNPEDVRNVRVSVWWDFENCQVPCNVNVYKVTRFITSAVRSAGIKGPIQITAFGDVFQLSRSNQEALSSTGINLTHIPNGGKNSADRSLLVDLMYWVSQNPPPAHLFLISGDRDFASTLHRLRMNNYNILLASTDSAPAVLCSAASIMWQWNSLVKGENLNGKHFNQPPDGPYASWYGHYRVTLVDPFAASNQTSCVQSEEASDSNSETKPRPIPKVVVNAIRNILNSYPKGLPITELRAELRKSSIPVEKDWYGHKKFSVFLMAMPNLLRMQSQKDGQHIIHGISPKSRETKDLVPAVASKEDGGQKTFVHPKEETLSSSSKLNEAKISTDSQALPKQQEEPLQVQEQKPPIIEKVKEGEVNLGQNITDTVNVDGNSAESKNQSADVMTMSSLSLSTDAAENVDSKPRGIFNRIVRWFKFSKNDKNSENLNDEFTKSDEEISSHSEMQEIFTESFWNDMLAFLESSKGSSSILNSKRRQEMVQNLQQFGPSRLQSLSEKHIVHVVELLISEKKWVVEKPYQTFPFRLVGPAKSSKPFCSKESDSNSQGQKRQVGGSVLPVKKIVSPQDRSHMFCHCQKLVNEVVKEYPGGFNIGSFRKLFLEKYGYQLEVQQLGFQKLATLLQIMPGVKLESNHIFPLRGFHSENNDLTRKEDDDIATEWEELGPIAQMKTKKKDDFETVSDNDLSDSEEKESSPRELQNQESSLLQILDSWYSKKEYGNNKTTSVGFDTNIDHLNNSMKPSEFYSDAEADPTWINYEQKQKLSKPYIFVADKPADEDKETLINGILGSLKKSGNGSPNSKIDG